MSCMASTATTTDSAEDSSRANRELSPPSAIVSRKASAVSAKAGVCQTMAFCSSWRSMSNSYTRASRPPSEFEPSAEGPSAPRNAPSRMTRQLPRLRRISTKGLSQSPGTEHLVPRERGPLTRAAVR